MLNYHYEYCVSKDIENGMKLQALSDKRRKEEENKKHDYYEKCKKQMESAKIIAQSKDQEMMVH